MTYQLVIRTPLGEYSSAPAEGATLEQFNETREQLELTIMKAEGSITMEQPDGTFILLPVPLWERSVFFLKVVEA